MTAHMSQSDIQAITGCTRQAAQAQELLQHTSAKMTNRYRLKKVVRLEK